MPFGRQGRLVTDALSNLPPFVKYVVVTFIPWIELRGAVPLAVGQGEQIYIPLIVLTNMAIFFPTYFILEWIYEHIPVGSWLHRKLESVRTKAHPLVEKYGFWGLALFVGIPLPGTGAYSGSCAAWLLDMDWRRSFGAVAIGVLLALAIVWSLSAGVVAGLKLL